MKNFDSQVKITRGEEIIILENESKLVGFKWQEGDIVDFIKSDERNFNNTSEINNSVPDLKASDTYLEKGNLKYENHDFEGAISDYKKSIQFFKDCSAAYFNLGVIYSKQYDYEKALKSFDKAIDIDITFGEAYLHRALIKTKLLDQKYSQPSLDISEDFRLGMIYSYPEDDELEFEEGYNIIKGNIGSLIKGYFQELSQGDF